MKTRLALAVVALQVLVLAFMAGQREWIARTGTPLTLRNAPIDPGDPMRGAYVRLDYEISFVPPALCRGEPAKWVKDTDYRLLQTLRDRVVYAALQVNPHGIAELAYLSDIAPARGPFLRGRVQSADSFGVRVRYGIEAFFMSQQAALKTESTALNERAGAPMNAHIAVGSSGIAVLKDFAWEPLGLTIAFDRPPRPQQTRVPGQPWQPQTLTGLTVTLHNYGDKDLALVTLPGARSFRLVRNQRFTAGHYAWAGESRTDPPAPHAEDILVLKPGATHAVHLDFTQPEWWVTDTNKPDAAPVPFEKIQDGWSASFRIEYAPPGPDTVRGLPHADLIRHAPLRSRAFNANQGVD
ncbi:MAG: GDYXXLXY domain-containing protein [Opitutae bacterium]|nr:GDYXXLXY domain-containing protein [Opitutae bacterium]